MDIKGILVTLIAPMNDHIANGGEKILGNASSIKQRPDGRVYISGQKQRHALFSAMERLNFEDGGRNGTYVSNGDGITTIIEKDLRADLGGFLDTNKESYSGRRTAPLTATPAVALGQSQVGRDLLIRLKVLTNDDSKKQALATREYSQSDEMLMSFFIDVGAVSIRKDFTYENEMHLQTHYHKHVDEGERKRRVRLALEATNSLTDYANNARNATSGEPQRVLIVFDTKLSRKAARYFTAEETEQKNILRELDKRGAKYFFGDDTASDGDSVMDAYEKAFAFLEENNLFDPTNGAKPITSKEYEQRTTS
jgi:CRISPR-associated protein Cst2